MKVLHRGAVVLLTTLALLATVHGQVARAPAAGTTLLRVRVLLNQSNPALEMIVNHPVVPKVQKLANPSRWIITLPRVKMSVPDKDLATQNDRITAVHFEQQHNPVAVVATVQLGIPDNNFTLTVTGNVITVSTMLPQQPAPAATPAAIPTGPTTLTAPPVAVPVASSSSGIALAGSTLANGTMLTAGSQTTVLRLARGGEVDLCPGTAVTVTSSQSGKQIMLSMNSGSMEAHYQIGAATDSIVTPDFRMQLTGPGQFEYAIANDHQGNTCVRSLPGNTSSLFVTELMGEGSYQVKANEQVVFHGGKLSQADHNIPAGCGCAVAPPPTQTAQAAAPAVASSLEGAARLAQNTPAASAPAPVSAESLSSQRSLPASASLSPTPPVTAPPPPTKPQDVHVQVDAPLLFNAADLPPQTPPANSGAANSAQPAANAAPPPQPAPAEHPPMAAPQAATVQAAPPEEPHRGFFGKIGNFFSSIFNKKTA